MNSDQLQALLHEQIPISAAMGVRVLEAEPRRVIVTAPLAANHNPAGTMFAGSQHSLASLAGWSLLRNWCSMFSWSAELVLGKAEIRYMKPANDDMRAAAELTDDQLERLRIARDRSGRARLELGIDLETSLGVCARFQGHYMARTMDPPAAGDQG